MCFHDIQIKIFSKKGNAPKTEGLVLLQTITYVIMKPQISNFLLCVYFRGFGALIQDSEACPERPLRPREASIIIL